MAGKGTALVTGAAGFIGSHLTEELLRQGYDVRTLVRYNSAGTRGWLDTLPEQTLNALDVIAGDIRDPLIVREAMRGCDYVFNLAALIAIPYSYHAPQSYVETNVMGALNVVQAARDLDVKHVIQTSTSEVYGTAQYVPIDEKHPLRGQSPYAATKTGADQLAMSFYCAFGTPVTIARPFNTYGPRQSTRAVIPTIIVQLASGAREIKLGNIKATRDFNFVKDTVAGMIKIAETPKAAGEILNLGSGFEISIEDTAKLIGELMGKSIEIKTEDNRLRPANSEVERLCADNSKALHILQWQPKETGLNGLKKGLRETIEWFGGAQNLAHYTSAAYRL